MKTNEKCSADQSRSLSDDGFEALLARIAKGSDAAMWELLDRYSRNILRAVRRRLAPNIRSKIDPEDIVQSVWKSFLRKRSQFELFTTSEGFIAYLVKMAQLKVFETHRHFKREAYDVHREETIEGPLVDLRREPHIQSPLVDRKGGAPSSLVRARDNWERALAKEGDLAQQVIQMRLQRLTQDQIAAQLKISKSSVRRILQSLLTSLTI